MAATAKRRRLDVNGASTPDTSAKGLKARPWWRKDADNVHQDVFAFSEFIRRANKQRRFDDKHHMKLYGNLDVAGQGVPGVTVLKPDGEGRLRYNICSSAVDTAMSLVGHARPRPMVMTTQGSWEQQRQARLRTRVLEGQLDATKAYRLGAQAVLDGCILGTGALKGVLDEDSEPKLERPLPGTIRVDHGEAISGKVRTIYEETLWPRDVLMELHGTDDEKREAIRTAKGPDQISREELWLNRDTTVDQVVVTEAWHLRSGKKAHDGKHVIAVSTGTLLDEEWKWDRLPFAFFRWKERQVGFHGMGLVEECRDAQWRINKLIKRMSKGQDLHSNVIVLADERANVNAQEFTNAAGTIITYSSQGAQPSVTTTSGTPPDIPIQIDRIREQTFSQLGLSTMAAEGKKPSGLDSGAAQRAHDDITSRRHIMNARNVEDFYLDVTELLELLNEMAAANENDVAIAAPSGRRSTLAQEVKWSEVRDPKHRYRWRMFPTSIIPTTPQGKWAAVQEWIGSGFISRPFAMQLLDFPDLDAHVRMELADLEAVMDDLEAAMEGEQIFPEPDSYDLPMAVEIARKAYLQAKADEAPEDVLQRLRDYRTYGLAQMAAANQQEQPAPAVEAAPTDVPAGELPVDPQAIEPGVAA